MPNLYRVTSDKIVSVFLDDSGLGAERPISPKLGNFVIVYDEGDAPYKLGKLSLASIAYEMDFFAPWAEIKEKLGLQPADLPDTMSGMLGQYQNLRFNTEDAFLSFMQHTYEMAIANKITFRLAMALFDLCDMYRRVEIMYSHLDGSVTCYVTDKAHTYTRRGTLSYDESNMRWYAHFM